MAEISFPGGAEGNEEFIMFPATVDGNHITCKILLEALANRFEAQLSNATRLLKVFESNRLAIETMDIFYASVEVK